MKGWPFKIIISVILLFTLLLVLPAPDAGAEVPVRDSVVRTQTGIIAGNTGALVKKEYVLDPILRSIARTFLRSLLDQIVNWISTGGKDGAPLFVQNWEKFLMQAADEAAAEFLNRLLGVNICSPFRVRIPQLIARASRSSLQQRLGCTLSQAIDANIRSFQDTFSGTGNLSGWDVWSQLANDPQNTFAGAYLIALDEQDRAMLQRAAARQNEAQAGAGFLGVKRCLGGFTDPDGKFICTKEEVVTPGRIIHDSLEKATNSDLDWLISADEIEEVLLAIADALIKRLITTSSGPNPTGFTSPALGGGAAGEVATALGRAKNLALPTVDDYRSVENQIVNLKQQVIDINTLTITELNRWKEVEERIKVNPKSLPEDISTVNTNIASINQQISLINAIQATTTQQLSDVRSRIRLLSSIRQGIVVAATIEEVNRLLDSALQFTNVVTNDRLALIQGAPQQEVSDANNRLLQARANLSSAQQREATINSRPEPGSESGSGSSGGIYEFTPSPGT